MEVTIWVWKLNENQSYQIMTKTGHWAYVLEDWESLSLENHMKMLLVIPFLEPRTFLEWIHGGDGRKAVSFWRIISMNSPWRKNQLPELHSEARIDWATPFRRRELRTWVKYPSIQVRLSICFRIRSMEGVNSFENKWSAHTSSLQFRINIDSDNFWEASGLEVQQQAEQRETTSVR